MEFDDKEILRLMKERRSIRAFKPDPIKQEKIDIILEAARWSQSANNAQPWRLIVIKNKEIIKKLKEISRYGSFIDQAPIVLAIIALKKKSVMFYLEDTSILTQQVCLIAWALGIGTCWIGTMDREEGARILDLRDDEYLTTILPLGYPKKVPSRVSRKSIKKLVLYLD